MGSTRSLLIVSHVVHYLWSNRIYAYGPYGREIDHVWAELFPNVTIAGPVRYTMPPPDCLPLQHSNITLAPQMERGGDSLGAKLRQMAALPVMALSLARIMRQADAIHVRCPGNLGLLGICITPWRARHMVAKYAGTWNGYPGERPILRLQRALLRSRWWKGPVLVYGQWPAQPSHVMPFFTSMMTEVQVQHALAVAQSRQKMKTPIHVLFSGRLAPEKRVAVLLRAVAEARSRGLAAEVQIVGDGPDRISLEVEARALGLTDMLHFQGGLPYDQAIRWNEWADVMVLPSKHSEGWPKVVAEAMSYGVVCIAVRHGQISSMLDGRGIVLDDGSESEVREALLAVSTQPAAFAALGKNAAAWAEQYSIESMRSALADLLTRQWGVPIQARSPRPADDQ